MRGSYHHMLNTIVQFSHTIIQHDKEHGKSTYISTLTDSISFDGHAATMLHKPFGFQHLHSPGLHAQLCMDGPASVLLFFGESNDDTYEAPQLQELMPQCWSTGFWVTYKDRA